MKNPKILVVDDDENLTLLMGVRLQASDYDVRIANSAGEAFRVFLCFKPNLVITDIGIGDENGLELINRIRKTGAGIKTVYMTGAPDLYLTALAEEKERYHVEILAKPFAGKELMDLVSAQMRGHQEAA